MSEFDLNGYRLADYVYLNGVLLAKLGFVLDPACADTGGGPIEGPGGGGGGSCDSIPVAYYYHTDHLGTPWYLTSQGKSVVWKGEYLPFGELYAETVSQTSYHRLPGQYKEDNTLYYNWHRWYDPTLGRYLQPDPIGLRFEPNLYVYALNNPILFTDPYGLFSIDDLKSVIKNPRIRAIASLGASLLAEKVATRLEPGKLRGGVYLISSGLAFFSAYESLQISVASYVFAGTMSETVIGALGGSAVGSFFFVVLLYDADLSQLYFRKALVDFGIIKKTCPPQPINVSR